jgi:hypothetical protein
MQIITAVVPSAGQGEVNHNAARVQILRDVIASARGDLLVCPAGVLRAPSEGRVLAVAKPLLEAAKAKKLAVVFGVDAERYGRIKRGPLPFFLVGWSPRDGVQLWRQRSRSSADAAGVPESEASARRVLHVAGKSVAFFACGEVFNPAIRAAVIELKPAVAILAAHFAAGARHWAPQAILKRHGVPSLRVAHASGPTDDRLVLPGGEQGPELTATVGGAAVRAWFIDERPRRKKAA